MWVHHCHQMNKKGYMNIKKIKDMFTWSHEDMLGIDIQNHSALPHYRPKI